MALYSTVPRWIGIFKLKADLDTKYSHQSQSNNMSQEKLENG